MAVKESFLVALIF